tara:strand:+ start:2431 stop:3057 length:627 start_codon:yes stop_codon:yes gene_type:complete
MSRSFSHWTPRYIFNRVRQFIYYKNHKNLPWLNKDGNDYLNKIIHHDWKVIEFGAGQSSGFFLKKIQKLISIEHNYEFYKKIKKNNLDHIKNNKFIFHYLKEKKDFLNFINSLDDESVDMVFVDSIFRYLVTSNILDKIKIDGFLILDNVNRFIPTNTHTPVDSGRKKNEFLDNKWEKLFKEKIFKKFETKITSDGISDTGFFVKKFN